MANLKIDDIVEVVVSTATPEAPWDGFSVGLILGKTVGTGMTADNRTLVVTSLEQMVEVGYATTTPEYKAATLYFSQYPKPKKLVLGLVASTGENTYETYVQALTAARAANREWYGAYIADETALTTAEVTAIAAYFENLRSVFFFDDSTAADLTDATTDIFSVLKSSGNSRVLGMYSTTKYAAAAVMGFAMGANTNKQNSAYTLAYKSLTGVATDDLTGAQVANLQNKNANYYIQRGRDYTLFEKGVTINGKWFDEVIGIDQLVYDIQKACMRLLENTTTKIPYTNDGAAKFVAACNSACHQAVIRGFLTSGIWVGDSFMNLSKGDALTAGYLCQVENVEDQPLEQKVLRICPPIYISAIMAGAIHSVTIKVDLV